jgi:hypothetical protein
MNAESFAGIVRHFMTALGGYLAATGVLDVTQTETIVGAVVALAGVAWSIWQKQKPAEPAA